MPRYFFHVKRGQMTVLDQKGIELANAAQAEEEAVHRAQQCLADDAGNGRPVSRGIVIVADENWLSCRSSVDRFDPTLLARARSG